MRRLQQRFDFNSTSVRLLITRNKVTPCRRIRAVTSRLLRSLEDILLRTVLFIKLLSCMRSDIVILDMLIVFTYLLTYLLFTYLLTFTFT